MSLLDDILEEAYYAKLAENPPAKKPKLDWTDKNAWTSEGYSGLVLHRVCSCGAKVSLLQGIFHIERTPSGAIRRQALDLSRPLQFPLDGDYPVDSTTDHVKICASCLPLKGFK